MIRVELKEARAKPEGLQELGSQPAAAMSLAAASRRTTSADEGPESLKLSGMPSLQLEAAASLGEHSAASLDEHSAASLGECSPSDAAEHIPVHTDSGLEASSSGPGAEVAAEVSSSSEHPAGTGTTSGGRQARPTAAVLSEAPPAPSACSECNAEGRNAEHWCQSAGGCAACGEVGASATYSGPCPGTCAERAHSKGARATSCKRKAGNARQPHSSCKGWRGHCEPTAQSCPSKPVFRVVRVHG